ERRPGVSPLRLVRARNGDQRDVQETADITVATPDAIEGQMRVSIFGLGYVGAVTAGCLADISHEIIGVDGQEAKVDALNGGFSSIVEPGLDDLVQRGRRMGCLRATTEAADAIRASDVSLLCVGTPALESGRLNLEFVRRVSEQIGDALRATGKEHV